MAGEEDDDDEDEDDDGLLVALAEHPSAAVGARVLMSAGAEKVVLVGDLVRGGRVAVGDDVPAAVVEGGRYMVEKWFVRWPACFEIFGYGTVL